MAEESHILALSRIADDLVGATPRVSDEADRDSLYTLLGIVRRSLVEMQPEFEPDVLAILACAYASITTLRAHRATLQAETIDELAGEVQLALNSVVAFIERTSPFSITDLGLSEAHSTVWN